MVIPALSRDLIESTLVLYKIPDHALRAVRDDGVEGWALSGMTVLRAARLSCLQSSRPRAGILLKAPGHFARSRITRFALSGMTVLKATRCPG